MTWDRIWDRFWDKSIELHTRTKNGTWTGLMGKLVGREIDMSAHIGISLMRQGAVDFCWPTFIKKVTLITSKPSKAKLDVWAYLQIFPGHR